MRAVLLVLLWSLAACAQALTPMADEELAAVRGAGLAFNLQDFSLSGGIGLTYTGDAGQTLWLGNLSLSRSDDPAATFSDPYRLQLINRANGMSDVISLSEPQNANGLLKWQLAADWAINADGIDFQGGALVLQDLQSYGGTLTLAPPATAGVEGFAFGLALRADVGALLLRPRGRDVDTEQLSLQGIHLSGALPGQPWIVADVTAQPGLINAITENGQSYLHVALSWPVAGDAPTGSLVVDNITFKTDAPGFVDPSTGQASTTFSLGSSRIASIQLQFVDIKLRAGP